MTSPGQPTVPAEPELTIEDEAYNLTYAEAAQRLDELTAQPGPSSSDEIERLRNRLELDLTDLSNGGGYVGSTNEREFTPETAVFVKDLAEAALLQFWEQSVPGEAVLLRVRRDFGEAYAKALVDRHRVSGRARRDVYADLDEIAIPARLSHDLPALHAPSGSTYVLGHGPDAVRMTVALLAVRAEPSDEQRAEDPRDTTEVQGEVRAGTSSSADASYHTANFRDLPFSLRSVVGLGRGWRLFRWLRSLTPGFDFRWTVNQFRRAVFTRMGADSFYVQRNRDPHHPVYYKLSWSVTVAPAVSSNPRESVSILDRPDPNLLTVWWPDHLARPGRAIRPVANVTKIVDAMFVIDQLHDPGSVERELRRRLPGLDKLEPESQRHLLELLGADSIGGAGPVLRTDGLFSEPLLDEDGNHIGVLRLKADFIPRFDVARTRRNPLELYHKGTVEETGAVTIRNDVSAVASAGTVVTPNATETMTELGTYSTGGLGGVVGMGVGESATQQSGGAGVVYRGLKSGMVRDGSSTKLQPAPALIQDVDVHWTATIETTDGTTEPVSWIGAASEYEGARTRHIPEALGTPNPALHPPASIEYGLGTGFAHLDQLRRGERGSGQLATHPAVGPLERAVRGWLAKNGYVCSKGEMTGKAVIQFRKLLNVQSSDYLEANWDDAGVGEGVFIPFERQTLFGIERVYLRLYFTRPANDVARHEGASITNRVIFNPEVNVELEGSHTTGGRIWGGFALDLVIGVINKVLKNVPLTLGMYQYTREASYESPTGWSYTREVFFQQQDGEPTHTFGANLQLRAAIYSPHDDDPVWRFVDETGRDFEVWSARFWVPEFRVLSTKAAPPTVSEPRDVTEADLAALGRPGDARLPTVAGVAEVGGSRQLSSMFRQLMQTATGSTARGWMAASLFGDSPAAHGSNSSQIRRYLVSPARLRAANDQLTRTAIASDQVSSHGFGSDEEGQLLLTAYPRQPRYVPPFAGRSVFYLEDWVHITDGGTQNETGSRNHQITPVRASLFRTRLGNWLLTYPNAAYRHSVTNTTTDLTTDDATDTRVTVHEGPMWHIEIPLTFIAVVEAASRNPARSVLSMLDFDVAKTHTLALDVEYGIEAHLNFDELLALWRVMKRINQLTGVPPQAAPIAGLPADVVARLDAQDHTLRQDEVAFREGRLPADRAVRYLPRRLVDRQGLGMGTISDVRERGVGDEGRTTLAAMGSQLHASGVAAIEAALPRVAQPGSTRYLPGVHQILSDISAPAALRAMVPRYFEAGRHMLPTQPVTLKSLTFVTTAYGGLVRLTVAVVARPDQSVPPENLRRLPGRHSTEAGIETYEQPGREVGKRRWRVVSPSVTAGVNALTPGSPETIRGHTPGMSATVTRRAALRLVRFYRYAPRTGAKAYEDAVLFSYPLELGITVQVQPLGAVSLNSVGPMVALGWHGTRRSPQWVPVLAHLRVPRADTPRRPVLPAPPSWQEHGPRLVPATLRDPRLPGLLGATPSAADPYLRLAGTMAPFADMPRDYMVSWFNASELLASAANDSIPWLSASHAVADEIDGWLAGRSTNAALHWLLRPGGDRRSYRRGLLGSVDLRGTVTIEPTHASPWAESTDHFEPDSQQHPPVVYFVGRGSDVIIENQPIRAMVSHLSAEGQQQVSVQFVGGTSPYVNNAVVDRRFGSAPGNTSSLTVNWFDVSLVAGATSRTRVLSGARSRRGVRFPGVAPETSPTHCTNTNRLVFRDVLFRVRGETEARPAGTSRWFPVQTREMALLVRVEVLAPAAQVPSAALIRWAPPSRRERLHQFAVDILGAPDAASRVRDVEKTPLDRHDVAVVNSMGDINMGTGLDRPGSGLMEASGVAERADVADVVDAVHRAGGAGDPGPPSGAPRRPATALDPTRPGAPPSNGLPRVIVDGDVDLLDASRGELPSWHWRMRLADGMTSGNIWHLAQGRPFAGPVQEFVRDLARQAAPLLGVPAPAVLELDDVSGRPEEPARVDPLTWSLRVRPDLPITDVGVTFLHAAAHLAALHLLAVGERQLILSRDELVAQLAALASMDAAPADWPAWRQELHRDMFGAGTYAPGAAHRELAEAAALLEPGRRGRGPDPDATVREYVARANQVARVPAERSAYAIEGAQVSREVRPEPWDDTRLVPRFQVFADGRIFIPDLPVVSWFGWRRAVGGFVHVSFRLMLHLDGRLEKLELHDALRLWHAAGGPRRALVPTETGAIVDGTHVPLAYTTPARHGFGRWPERPAVQTGVRVERIAAGWWLRSAVEGTTDREHDFRTAVHRLPRASPPMWVVGGPGKFAVDLTDRMVLADLPDESHQLVFANALPAGLPWWLKVDPVSWNGAVALLHTAGEVFGGEDGVLYSTEAWKRNALYKPTTDEGHLLPVPAWRRKDNARLPDGVLRIRSDLLLVFGDDPVDAVPERLALLPARRGWLTLLLGSGGQTRLDRLRALLDKLPVELARSTRVAVLGTTATGQAIIGKYGPELSLVATTWAREAGTRPDDGLLQNGWRPPARWVPALGWLRPVTGAQWAGGEAPAPEHGRIAMTVAASSSRPRLRLPSLVPREADLLWAAGGPPAVNADAVDLVVWSPDALEGSFRGVAAWEPWVLAMADPVAAAAGHSGGYLLRVRVGAGAAIAVGTRRAPPMMHGRELRFADPDTFLLPESSLGQVTVTGVFEVDVTGLLAGGWEVEPAAAHPEGAAVADWRPPLRRTRPAHRYDPAVHEFIAAYRALRAQAPQLMRLTDPELERMGAGLRWFAGGLGWLTSYVPDVFGDPQVTAVLRDLDGWLGPVPADCRAKLAQAVADLLLAVALVPTQEVWHDQDRSTRKTIEPISFRQLPWALRGILGTVQDGADPFGSSTGFGVIGYDPDLPLHERLARLNLLRLSPSLRQKVRDRLAEMPPPRAVARAWDAVGRAEQTTWVNGAAAAAHLWGLRSRVHLWGLVEIARSFVDDVAGALERLAVETPLLLDLPDQEHPHRTIEKTAEERLKAARAAIAAIDKAISDGIPVHVRGAEVGGRPASPATLVERLGRSLQELARYVNLGAWSESEEQTTVTTGTRVTLTVDAEETAPVPAPLAWRVQWHDVEGSARARLEESDDEVTWRQVATHCPGDPLVLAQRTGRWLRQEVTIDGRATFSGEVAGLDRPLPVLHDGSSSPVDPVAIDAEEYGQQIGRGLTFDKRLPPADDLGARIRDVAARSDFWRHVWEVGGVHVREPNAESPRTGEQYRMLRATRGRTGAPEFIVGDPRTGWYTHLRFDQFTGRGLLVEPIPGGGDPESYEELAEEPRPFLGRLAEAPDPGQSRLHIHQALIAEGLDADNLRATEAEEEFVAFAAGQLSGRLWQARLRRRLVRNGSFFRAVREADTVNDPRALPGGLSSEVMPEEVARRLEEDFAAAARGAPSRWARLFTFQGMSSERRAAERQVLDAIRRDDVWATGAAAAVEQVTADVWGLRLVVFNHTDRGFQRAHGSSDRPTVTVVAAGTEYEATVRVPAAEPQPALPNDSAVRMPAAEPQQALPNDSARSSSGEARPVPEVQAAPPAPEARAARVREEFDNLERQVYAALTERGLTRPAVTEHPYTIRLTRLNAEFQRIYQRVTQQPETSTENDSAMLSELRLAMERLGHAVGRLPREPPAATTRGRAGRGRGLRPPSRPRWPAPRDFGRWPVDARDDVSAADLSVAAWTINHHRAEELRREMRVDGPPDLRVVTGGREGLAPVSAEILALRFYLAAWTMTPAERTRSGIEAGSDGDKLAADGHVGMRAVLRAAYAATRRFPVLDAPMYAVADRETLLDGRHLVFGSAARPAFVRPDEVLLRFPSGSGRDVSVLLGLPLGSVVVADAAAHGVPDHWEAEVVLERLRPLPSPPPPLREGMTLPQVRERAWVSRDANGRTRVRVNLPPGAAGPVDAAAVPADSMLVESGGRVIVEMIADLMTEWRTADWVWLLPDGRPARHHPLPIAGGTASGLLISDGGGAVLVLTPPERFARLRDERTTDLVRVLPGVNRVLATTTNDGQRIQVWHREQATVVTLGPEEVAAAVVAMVERRHFSGTALEWVVDGPRLVDEFLDRFRAALQDDGLPGVVEQITLVRLGKQPAFELGPVPAATGEQVEVPLGIDDVRLFRGGGVWHVWVGLKPDPAVMRWMAVRPGTAVVHRHGAGDGSPLTEGTRAALREGLTLARADGVSQAALLACEQTQAQAFATAHALTVWASEDRVFVSPRGGRVFIGRAEIGPDGRLRVVTKMGEFRRFEPDGSDPAEPSYAPVIGLDAKSALAHAGPWFSRFRAGAAARLAAMPGAIRWSPRLAAGKHPRRRGERASPVGHGWDVRRAYLTAADNRGRRAALLQILPAAGYEAVDALARFVSARAATRADRADAVALELVAKALSGADSFVLDGRAITGLGPEATYEWISAVLPLRALWPQHAGRLTALLVKTFARCA
ncbi:hypothetical protein [Micromonospora sp. NPDC023814]|uniref:hypothetical protein n=1 Tax=Micromonospora sp. NPDC023814 TaxID=3154596 RepID=UPI0033D24DBE